MRNFFFLLVMVCLLSSCIKEPIAIIDNEDGNDPNISYFDNYKVDIATYKLDSFITSANTTFSIGRHRDPYFGVLSAGAYAQINLPADNPVRNKSVTFDSLVVILRPGGDYYGDTLLPFTIRAHRLLQNIENEEAANLYFYNSRKVIYDQSVIGNLTTSIRPRRNADIRLRLPDALGQEWLLKLKNNNTDIQSNENFINYFKGLYFGTDTLTVNSIYYFKPHNDKNIIRLYYHVNGAFVQEQFLDFTVSNTQQFNHLAYSHAGTNLSGFTPFKKQLRKSSQTGKQAYLNSNMGSYIKVNFPDILQLKELHPYVKVMKAELVVTPTPGTYRYPYRLPEIVYLYTTDDGNALNSVIIDPFTQAPLTGNLVVDRLYGEKTRYTYDITGFINTLVAEGRFSKLALMLAPSTESLSTQLQRLIINDQNLNYGIQLKLYLLGL